MLPKVLLVIEGSSSFLVICTGLYSVFFFFFCFFFFFFFFFFFLFVLFLLFVSLIQASVITFLCYYCSFGEHSDMALRSFGRTTMFGAMF